MVLAADSMDRKLQDGHGPRTRAPVAAQFEDCTQAFVRLSDSLTADSDNFHPALDDPTTKNGTEATPLHERAQHFRRTFSAWGNDSGASSRTLDHALKESPSLMRQTMYLLEDLYSTLERSM